MACSLIMPIMLFVSYFFIVGERYPVHGDAIQSVDRGINLFHGQGYITTSHKFIDPEVGFSISAAPLQDGGVYLWLRIFGDSLLAIRGFSYFAALLAGVLITLGAKRLNIVPTPWLTGLLLLVLLFAEPLMMSYGYSRYDTIGICVSALIFFSVSIRTEWLKYLLLGISGLSLSIAGPQFVVYGFIIAFLVFILTNKQYFRELLFVAAVGVLGYILLLLVYWYMGQLGSFINGVLQFEQTTANVYGRLPSIYKSLTRVSANLVLIAIFVVTVILSFKNSNFRKMGLIGLLIGVLIPVVFNIVGHYSRWYQWMAFVPMTLCLFSIFQKIIDRYKTPIRSIAIAMVSLALIGMNAPRTAVSSLVEWEERDYRKVDGFVQQFVQEGDVILADSYTFFAVRRYSDSVFAYKTIPNISKQTLNSINKAFYSYKNGEEPKDLRNATETLGGCWQTIGGYKAKRSDLRVKLFGTPKEEFVYEIEVFEKKAIKCF